MLKRYWTLSAYTRHLTPGKATDTIRDAAVMVGGVLCVEHPAGDIVRASDVFTGRDCSEAVAKLRGWAGCRTELTEEAAETDFPRCGDFDVLFCVRCQAAHDVLTELQLAQRDVALLDMMDRQNFRIVDGDGDTASLEHTEIPLRDALAEHCERFDIPIE